MEKQRQRRRPTASRKQRQRLLSKLRLRTLAKEARTKQQALRRHPQRKLTAAKDRVAQKMKDMTGRNLVWKKLNKNQRNKVVKRVLQCRRVGKGKEKGRRIGDRHQAARIYKLIKESQQQEKRRQTTIMRNRRKRQRQKEKKKEKKKMTLEQQQQDLDKELEDYNPTPREQSPPRHRQTNTDSEEESDQEPRYSKQWETIQWP